MNSNSVCIAATAVDIPGSSTIHFLKNCTAAIQQRNKQELKIHNLSFPSRTT